MAKRLCLIIVGTGVVQLQLCQSSVRNLRVCSDITDVLTSLGLPPTLAAWQSALGKAVCEFPPMGPDQFEPAEPTPTAEIMNSLPLDVAQAWTLPFQLDQQVELSNHSGFSMPECYQPTNSTYAGIWWTLPSIDGGYLIPTLTTSGPWLDAPSVASFGVEDNWYEPWPHPKAPASRMVRPRFTPRVYEVDTWESWVTLVNRYPFPRPRRRRPDEIQMWFGQAQFVEPDWALVAKDYDAVHLTQVAYVGGAYRKLPCSAGVTSICGWGPDLTAWLRNPQD